MANRKPQLKELNDEEKDLLLPVLIKFLETKTNDLVHYTGDEIVEAFNERKERIKFKGTFNKQRLMKLTNYIRANQLTMLMSDHSGYWVTKDEAVILEVIASLLHRIESQKAAVDGLKRLLSEIRLEKQKDFVEDPFGITDWK